MPNEQQRKKRARKAPVYNPKFKVCWTNEEDEKLLILVKQFGTKSWNRVSKTIKKSEIKCHTRWLELTNSAKCDTGTWTLDEDCLLVKQVKLLGTGNWTRVAEGIPGRIGKQCRERWYKHLDPTISKSKWTLEEDINIVKLYCEHGSSWSKIA